MHMICCKFVESEYCSLKLWAICFVLSIWLYIWSCWFMESVRREYSSFLYEVFWGQRINQERVKFLLDTQTCTPRSKPQREGRPLCPLTSSAGTVLPMVFQSSNRDSLECFQGVLVSQTLQFCNFLYYRSSLPIFFFLIYIDTQFSLTFEKKNGFNLSWAKEETKNKWGYWCIWAS